MPSLPIVSGTETIRALQNAESTLARAARNMALSARGISRCAGVARTIACLAYSDETDAFHVSEALQYRVAPNETAAKVATREPA